VKYVLLLLLAAGVIADGRQCFGRDRRPNILLIVVDDQSPQDLQLYNPNSPLRTPSLDRLAARGVVLDNAVHMGSFSGAVCTPSRHMLMCGRTLWHLPIGPQVPQNSLPGLPRKTLAAVFNDAGYATMRTCKTGNSYEAANRQFTVRRDATKREGTESGGSAWHAQQVLDYLDEREAARDVRPFLIWFGFSHPHDTRNGTPELLARYHAVNHSDPQNPPELNPRLPALPPNYLPQHPFNTSHSDVRDEVAVSGVWKRRDPATVRNELGREFACSENIDQQIEKVLQRLQTQGQLENTIIIYTADHGMSIGRHGLMGKQNLYQHTWQVPFIAAGPGIAAGRRAAGNVYLLDLLATVCDFAGIQPPETNEGISMKPVLTGRTEIIRDVLYGAYSGGAAPGIRCVSRGDWKLIVYKAPQLNLNQVQLFNLQQNPHELLPQHHAEAVSRQLSAAPAPLQTNLADQPQYAAQLQQMRQLLKSEMQRLDDPAVSEF
jgi:arylsulfatase A-like enzyme